MTLAKSLLVIVYWQALNDSGSLYRDVPGKQDGANDGRSNE